MARTQVKSRLGFTLVELLVVVGIIAVLIGLILVGIQQARASAGRVGATYNLGQLGIAFNSYHTIKNQYPTESSGSSFYTALLPYVEQKNALPTTPISGYLDPARRDTSVGAKRDLGYASSHAFDSQGPSILDQASGVRQADVINGLANTYLLASVWMSPGSYNGGDPTDVGWAQKANARMYGGTIKRDSDATGTIQYLGSAHAGSLPQLYADGHVQPRSYDNCPNQWSFNGSTGAASGSLAATAPGSSTPSGGSVQTGSTNGSTGAPSGSLASAAPGSSATNPLMPSGGSAQTGYTFNNVVAATTTATTSGSPTDGPISASQSNVPDWGQVIADANTIETMLSQLYWSNGVQAGYGQSEQSWYLTTLGLVFKYSSDISGFGQQNSTASQMYDYYNWIKQNGTSTTPPGANSQWLTSITAWLADAASTMKMEANWFQMGGQYIPGEVFIDPDIATGYEYTSTVNFKSVLIPKPLAGGQSKFELVVGAQTFPLEAGKRFYFTTAFPEGVNAFTIRGIDVSEKLDASNMAAFVTGVTFMKEGPADVKMLPIVKRSSWWLTGWGLGGSLLSLLLLVGMFFTGLAWRRSNEAA
jgi:prepilin-type N-terminal cleavage/methylation domain-containing protein